MYGRVQALEAGFGDGAQLLPFARTFFARNQSQLTGYLVTPPETADIAHGEHVRQHRVRTTLPVASSGTSNAWVESLGRRRQDEWAHAPTLAKTARVGQPRNCHARVGDVCLA